VFPNLRVNDGVCRRVTRQSSSSSSVWRSGFGPRRWTRRKRGCASPPWSAEKHPPAPGPCPGAACCARSHQTVAAEHGSTLSEPSSSATPDAVTHKFEAPGHHFRPSPPRRPWPRRGVPGRDGAWGDPVLPDLSSGRTLRAGDEDASFHLAVAQPPAPPRERRRAGRCRGAAERKGTHRPCRVVRRRAGRTGAHCAVLGAGGRQAAGRAGRSANGCMADRRCGGRAGGVWLPPMYRRRTGTVVRVVRYPPLRSRVCTAHGRARETSIRCRRPARSSPPNASSPSRPPSRNRAQPPGAGCAEPASAHPQ
jgi:hypothetical protein